MGMQRGSKAMMGSYYYLKPMAQMHFLFLASIMKWRDWTQAMHICLPWESRTMFWQPVMFVQNPLFYW